MCCCNYFRYENFCDLSTTSRLSVLQLFFNWHTRRMCNLLLLPLLLLSLSNSFNSQLIYACLLLRFSFADRNTDTHTHTQTHTERGGKQIMKMKRESNDGDGPQDQKRNRRNEETVRILIPSSVSIGWLPPVNPILNPA